MLLPQPSRGAGLCPKGRLRRPSTCVLLNSLQWGAEKPVQTILNILRRRSALEGLACNCRLLNCGPRVVTSFQKGQFGEGRRGDRFTVEKTDNLDLGRTSEANAGSDQAC